MRDRQAKDMRRQTDTSYTARKYTPKRHEGKIKQRAGQLKTRKTDRRQIEKIRVLSVNDK